LEPLLRVSASAVEGEELEMTLHRYMDAWLRSAKPVRSVALFTNYGKQWNMTPVSDHPRAPMCSSPLFAAMRRMHVITSAVLDIPHAALRRASNRETDLLQGSRQGLLFLGFTVMKPTLHPKTWFGPTNSYSPSRARRSTGGHGGAMWKVIVSGGLLLAANKGTPEARCEDALFGDQPLPFGAEIGSSIAAAGTAAVFSALERDAHRIFVTTVTGTKEALFVLLVLYIFATLPRVGSIALAVVWFCGGPWLLRSAWAVIHFCASHPNTLLALVSAYTLVHTKLFQSVGLALGLDLNRDGSVDARDVFYELYHRASHYLFPSSPPTAAEGSVSISARVTAIEQALSLAQRDAQALVAQLKLVRLDPQPDTTQDDAPRTPRGPTQKEFDDLKSALAEALKDKEDMKKKLVTVEEKEPLVRSQHESDNSVDLLRQKIAATLQEAETRLDASQRVLTENKTR
jgi:hypothetical protein